jgi:hypothetical protein
MKSIYLFFILPIYAFGQTTFVLPKDVQTKGYTLAIGEYIKTMKATNKTSFDTLFFGKHEDFPDIKLPTEIENTKIIVLTNAEAEKKYANRRSIAFINMIDDFTKDMSLFKLVVFKTEKMPEKINWWPLYDYNVNFNYSLNTKVFTKEKSNFEYPYYNKYTDKK